MLMTIAVALTHGACGKNDNQTKSPKRNTSAGSASQYESSTHEHETLARKGGMSYSLLFAAFLVGPYFKSKL